MNCVTTFTLGSESSQIAIDAILFKIEINTVGRAEGDTRARLDLAGLPEHTRREMMVRIQSACELFTMPFHRHDGLKATVTMRGVEGYSLNPLPGMAAGLDLPIALAALGIAPAGIACAGGLGLDGGVRPVRGITAFVHACIVSKLAGSGITGVLVPIGNVREALDAANGSIAVYAIRHLGQLEEALARAEVSASPAPTDRKSTPIDFDFSDIRCNAPAVARIADAVRTGKDIILTGPPSPTLTMIARRIPTIMKPLPDASAATLTKIYSSLGLADRMLTERPFRAPHHSISAAALAGTSNELTATCNPPGRAGEVHLASYGVLMLDMISDWPVFTLAALREAMREMHGARPMIVGTVHTYPRDTPGSAAKPGSLERILAQLGIVAERIEVATEESLSEGRRAPPGRSSQDIRSEIWGMS